MDSHGSEETQRLREAHRWSRKLTAAGEVERRAFAAWVRESPDNLKAFLLSTALDTEITKQGTLSKHDSGVSQIDLSSNVRRLPVRHLPPENSSPQGSPVVGRKLPWSTLMWMAVAATVVMALLIAQGLPPYLSRPVEIEFITNIGERHTFTLPDGTLLELNTDSHVMALYTPTRRDLSIERGEIWIDVASDRRRPFRVRASGVDIQDIGTTFTVRKSSNETTVYVVNGRTRVSTIAPTSMTKDGHTLEGYCASSLEIGAGTEAVVKTNGDGTPATISARAMTALESDKRIAWTRGRLIINGEPLRDVIREVNRYQKRRIVIVDPGLETLKVGGTIDPTTDEYQGIVRALAPTCSIITDESNPAVVQLRIDERSGCRPGK